MEVIRFINWWWNKNLSPSDRAGFIVVGGIISSIVIMFFLGAEYGPLAVLAFIAGIVFFAICLSLFFAIRGQWRKYKTHKEAEAQAIIDRLKTPIVQTNSQVEDMLATIRKRRAQKTTP